MEQSRLAPIADRLQPAIDWTGNASLELLQFAGVFLKPLTLTLSALAAWRLGADLGVTGDFFVDQGIFSHWHVWVALAIATQMASTFTERLLAKAKIPSKPAKQS